MQFARTATSELRHMTIPTDIHAFRNRRGGHLGGTMHCAVYVGTPVLWDGQTGELLSPEGLALNLPPNGLPANDTQDAATEHLQDELHTVRNVVHKATGHLADIHGVLIPVKGKCHFRIYDMIHTKLPLHAQVNVLADVFASGLSNTLQYTRPVQYFHSPALDSEKRVERWMKSWKKRPGCCGVSFKDLEFVYQPSGDAGENATACNAML